MKITVLMSTYNGTKYISQQLDSILNQKFNGELDILVRDDGSSDGTQAILDKYQKEHKNFKWYQGENKKPAKSFWELLSKVSGSDFYSFADQDDVWDLDKLQIAVDSLLTLNQNNPLLYMCDARVVDQDLNVISNEFAVKDIPIDYPKSLMNNICAGCTYVFNEHARKLASEYDPEKYAMKMHDWKLYTIVLCFGEIFFDHIAHMSYRQHGDNAVGAIKSKLHHYIDLLKHDRDPKEFFVRKNNALGLEAAYGDKMSEENRYLTHLIAHYDEDKKLKKALLKDKRFKYSRKQYWFFKHRIKKNRF